MADIRLCNENRYNVSKLLEVLFVREFVSRISDAKSSSRVPPPVIIDMVNPGFCISSLDRDQNRVVQIITFIARRLIGRSTEQGSRTLVYGACAGPASHGEFMSDGQNQEVERWIYSDVGKRAQKKVFDQTMKALEARSPGVGKAVGV